MSLNVKHTEYALTLEIGALNIQRVLSAALGFLVQERHWHIGASPAEKHRDVWCLDAYDVEREAWKNDFA